MEDVTQRLDRLRQRLLLERLVPGLEGTALTSTDLQIFIVQITSTGSMEGTRTMLAGGSSASASSVTTCVLRPGQPASASPQLVDGAAPRAVSVSTGLRPNSAQILNTSLRGLTPNKKFLYRQGNHTFIIESSALLEKLRSGGSLRLPVTALRPVSVVSNQVTNPSSQTNLGSEANQQQPTAGQITLLDQQQLRNSSSQLLTINQSSQINQLRGEQVGETAVDPPGQDVKDGGVKVQNCSPINEGLASRITTLVSSGLTVLTSTKPAPSLSTSSSSSSSSTFPSPSLGAQFLPVQTSSVSTTPGILLAGQSTTAAKGIINGSPASKLTIISSGVPASGGGIQLANGGIALNTLTAAAGGAAGSTAVAAKVMAGSTNVISIPTVTLTASLPSRAIAITTSATAINTARNAGGTTVLIPQGGGTELISSSNGAGSAGSGGILTTNNNITGLISAGGTGLVMQRAVQPKTAIIHGGLAQTKGETKFVLTRSPVSTGNLAPNSTATGPPDIIRQLNIARCQGLVVLQQWGDKQVLVHKATGRWIMRQGNRLVTVPPQALGITPPPPTEGAASARVQGSSKSSAASTPSSPAISSRTMEQLAEFDSILESKFKTETSESECIASPPPTAGQPMLAQPKSIVHTLPKPAISPVVAKPVVISNPPPLAPVASPTPLGGAAVTPASKAVVSAVNQPPTQSVVVLSSGSAPNNTRTLVIPTSPLKKEVITSPQEKVGFMKGAPVTKLTPLKSPVSPTTFPKPQEDPETLKRIQAILDNYNNQMRNSPDLHNRPAPRRRTNGNPDSPKPDSPHGSGMTSGSSSPNSIGQVPPSVSPSLNPPSVSPSSSSSPSLHPAAKKPATGVVKQDALSLAMAEIKEEEEVSEPEVSSTVDISLAPKPNQTGFTRQIRQVMVPSALAANLAGHRLMLVNSGEGRRMLAVRPVIAVSNSSTHSPSFVPRLRTVTCSASPSLQQQQQGSPFLPGSPATPTGYTIPITVSLPTSPLPVNMVNLQQTDRPLPEVLEKITQPNYEKLEELERPATPGLGIPMEMTPGQIMEAEISATLMDSPASPYSLPHPLSPPSSEYRVSVSLPDSVFSIEGQTPTGGAGQLNLAKTNVDRIMLPVTPGSESEETRSDHWSEDATDRSEETLMSVGGGGGEDPRSDNLIPPDQSFANDEDAKDDVDAADDGQSSSAGGGRRGRGDAVVFRANDGFQQKSASSCPDFREGGSGGGGLSVQNVTDALSNITDRLIEPSSALPDGATQPLGSKRERKPSSRQSFPNDTAVSPRSGRRKAARSAEEPPEAKKRRRDRSEETERSGSAFYQTDGSKRK